MAENPVILLIGEESFLIDREIKKVEQRLFKGENDDFNRDRFHLSDDDLEKVIGHCQTLPVMVEQRLVIAEGCETLKKSQLEHLLWYFQSPSPSTCLILTASKIDKRLKVWQLASKKRWLHELKVPYPNQMVPWLVHESKERGLNLAPDAAHYMVEAMGNQLMAHISALEKLEIYVTPQKKITLQDVTEVIGDFDAKTIFNLTDYVGRGKLSEALMLLGHMRERGEPTVGLMHMLGRHFKLLMLAHEALHFNLDERSIAQRLGVHPFFAKDYISQSKRFQPQTLVRIYHHLLDSDRQLKSSGIDPEIIADRFLMEACLLHNRSSVKI